MKKHGRRKFLRQCLIGGSTLAGGTVLSSCSSLNRFIDGSEDRDPNRVLIIGGGLAGLAAANELRQLKIPFLLLEAAPRWGGRVLTLENFNSGGQVAELGGEWIYPNQKTIITLATEMHLDIEQRKWEAGDFDLGPSSVHGPWQKLRPAWAAAAARVAKILGGAASAHVPPLDELQKIAKIDPDFLRILKRSLEIDKGAGFDTLPAAEWIKAIQDSNSVFWPGTRIAYRLADGAQALALALYDRAAGVIPGRRVQSDCFVEKITKVEDSYTVRFLQSGSYQELTAKSVIVAVPPSALIKMDKRSSLSLSPTAREWLGKIRYGTPTKGAIAFKNRPWEKQIRKSRWLSESLPVGYVEVEPRNDRPQISPQSVLSFTWGGADGDKFSERELKLISGDLSVVGAEPKISDIAQYNWALNPLIENAFCFFDTPPNSPEASQLSWEEVWTVPNEKFAVAGEFTSPSHRGTMNGALESGKMAANCIARRQSAIS